MTAIHMPYLPTCHSCGERPGYKERRVTCKRCQLRLCSYCFHHGRHTRAKGVKPTGQCPGPEAGPLTAGKG